MDIKQRLRAWMHHDTTQIVEVTVSVLRDALAEIERLEKIPPAVVYPQHGQLLERIASALEGIYQQLQEHL